MAESFGFKIFKIKKATVRCFVNCGDVGDMSTILIILFLISYLFLAKIRLDWAVMFLIAALPSYLIRFSVFGVPFTLLEAMILISFAVWVIANQRELIANIRKTVAAPLLASGGGLRRSGEKARYPFDIEIILLLNNKAEMLFIPCYFINKSSESFMKFIFQIGQPPYRNPLFCY